MTQKAHGNMSKGLPKRVSSPGYIAKKARYISERRREKNRAHRIVRDAMRSKNPRKVAINQAKKSAARDIMGTTLAHTIKILEKRGL